MIFPFQPLLAAGEAQIIFAIIIGIIAFINWISKAVKGNKKDEQVAQQQNRPNNDPIRNEIESFLQDVLGTKPKKKKVDKGDFLELVEEEPRRKPQRKKKQLKRKKKKTSIENRSVGQSAETFGDGLSDHVDDHMQVQHFEEHIGHDINQSVSQHLGSFDSGSFADDDIQMVDSGGDLRSEVLEMFRNPTDVRKAIIMDIILTPPSSLKRK